MIADKHMACQHYTNVVNEPNELKSLDSKNAIKNFSTKIWIIHKVRSILVDFGHL